MLEGAPAHKSSDQNVASDTVTIMSGQLFSPGQIDYRIDLGVNQTSSIIASCGARADR
jgi:hypothetical protein